MALCLPVYQSVYLSTRVSVFLVVCIHAPVYPSGRLACSPGGCLSVYRSIGLAGWLSLCLSFWLSPDVAQTISTFRTAPMLIKIFCQTITLPWKTFFSFFTGRDESHVQLTGLKLRPTTLMGNF